MVAAGSFCFSMAIPFIRWTDGLSTPTIAFSGARFLFLCTLVSRFREPLQFRAYRSAVPRLVVLGIFVSMTVSLYTYAIQRTTAATAALLVNSSPIYVAVLAPLVPTSRALLYRGQPGAGRHGHDLSPTRRRYSSIHWVNRGERALRPDLRVCHTDWSAGCAAG